MKYEIKNIDIFSALKFIFIISLFIGALLGIFQALFFSFIGALLQNFAGEGFGGGFDSMSLATPFFMIVFTAIFFAIFNSFIIGIVLLFYNVVSQWIGGVRIELEEDSNYVTLREMDE